MAPQLRGDFLFIMGARIGFSRSNYPVVAMFKNAPLVTRHLTEDKQFKLECAIFNKFV